MTQDYKQSCKSVVDEFLKNATRFDFSEYEILDYNEFLYSFKIKVINELDIESKYKILTGLHKGNSGDFFFTDEESLRNKMSIYLKAEINDSKNLDLLASITRITSFFTASTATMTTNLASTTTIITNYFAISIAFFTNMTIIKLRLNFSNVFIFFKGGKSAILYKAL